MRIVNLVENTEGRRACPAEHGLSYYIESAHHKILMDTGQSDLFLKNAQALGVDLTQVDTVVISHGHYDHGGGLPAFLKVNEKAKIYIQSSARGEFYSSSGTPEPHYIGLSEEFFSSGRITWIDGERILDEELSLFSHIGTKYPIPSANRALLMKTPEGFVPDDFAHEQCLVVREGEQLVLFSGCAHHGILNVLDRFRELYGRNPDAVLSGFHLKKKEGYGEDDARELVELAYALKEQGQTLFYTGHCTGEEPFAVLKSHLGDRLCYVHCGDTVKIGEKKAEEAEENPETGPEEKPEPEPEERPEEKPEKKPREKKRRSFMKWHRFFAWATVICFLLTMWTGYKKK